MHLSTFCFFYNYISNYDLSYEDIIYATAWYLEAIRKSIFYAILFTWDYAVLNYEELGQPNSRRAIHGRWAHY